MSILELAGGRIKCRQCDAKSKRTQQQCRAPAMKGKTKCATHGGKSTGPKTTEGRARCAAAKTTHGRESRSARESRSIKGAELSALENLCFEKGIMIGGRARGRKPKHYHAQQQQLLAALDQPHSDCHLMRLVALKNQSANQTQHACPSNLKRTGFSLVAKDSDSEG